MTYSYESRRDFLKQAMLAAAALPVLAACKTSMFAQRDDTLALIKKNAITSATENWCGAIDAPEKVSWRTALKRKSEKDQPMIISGTIYKPDGRTPAPNVLVYFYHTDSDGYYGRGNGEIRHGHFRGWLLTDSRGRYEFQSIKPAAYPDRTFAAHVHMTLTTADKKEDWVDSILFEGDRFLTAQDRVTQRGVYNHVVNLEKGGDGILRAVRNIQLS